MAAMDQPGDGQPHGSAGHVHGCAGPARGCAGQGHGVPAAVSGPGGGGACPQRILDAARGINTLYYNLPPELEADGVHDTLRELHTRLGERELSNVPPVQRSRPMVSDHPGI